MAARFDLNESVNQPMSVYGDGAKTDGAFRNYRHAANYFKEGSSTFAQKNYLHFITKARAATKKRKREKGE